MPIELLCETSGQTLRAPDQMAGKLLQCPHCKQAHRIPLPAEPAPPPIAAPPADTGAAPAAEPAVAPAEPPAPAPDPDAPTTQCPYCLTPLRATSGSHARCPACAKEFECLFAPFPEGVRSRAEPKPAPKPTAGPCRFHPDVPGPYLCRRCRARMCPTCSFETSVGRFCPNCINAGPSEDSVRGGRIMAIFSILLAACAPLSFVFLIALAATDDEISSRPNEGLATILGFGMYASTLLGLVLGFVSRDRMRAAGSVLPLVGLVLNGLLLVGLLVLGFVGAMMK